MSTLVCCCCAVTVQANDPYGHPIVGAAVTLYWNPATKGAFLDPAANGDSQGPYLTDASGQVEITVDDPGNGVYVAGITKDGYAPQYKFLWACGAPCFDVSNPRLGTGRLYFAGAPLVTTGFGLMTNVQTGPLYDGNLLPNVIGGSASWVTATTPISGAFDPTVGSPIPTAAPVGGTFALRSGPANPAFTPYPSCADSTGTPGLIAIGCVPGGAGVEVTAYCNLVVCPGCNDNQGFTPTTSCTLPTAYGDGNNSATAILRSRVTSIEYSPFRVRGTWDAAYSSLGTYTAWRYGGTVGGPPQPFWNQVATTIEDPGPGLTPLNGDFVIQ